MSEFVIEIDEQLYEDACVVAKEHGITVEQMLAEFMRWCAAEETRDDAARKINQWIANRG